VKVGIVAAGCDHVVDRPNRFVINGKYLYTTVRRGRDSSASHGGAMRARVRAVDIGRDYFGLEHGVHRWDSGQRRAARVAEKSQRDTF